MIRTSWERCERPGLPIGQLSVPSTSSFDSDTRLGHSAQAVLRTLHNHLSNEPISIMLSDETGLVITRLCNDRAIVRSLDEVALAPGSTYSGPAVGTNGFGLALATNAPALVAGDDHDSPRLTGYTCAGVPIHDPVDGTLIGTLSLTTWSTQRTDLLLALAGQTAMNIEARLSVGSPALPVAELDARLPSPSRRGIAADNTATFRLSRFEIIERDAIVDALARHSDAVADAAEDHGFPRATMYRKVKRYGIRQSR